MPAPRYLYKILDEAPPEPLPPTLPATQLDASDGFIHLSTTEQTKHTAKMFFSAHKELWILKIERERLDGRLEYTTEPNLKIQDGCPHLHDSVQGLGSGSIQKVIHVRREAEQDWTEVESMSSL